LSIEIAGKRLGLNKSMLMHMVDLIAIAFSLYKANLR